MTNKQNRPLMTRNTHERFVFVDTQNFIISGRSLALAQGDSGEHNADPVAIALLSKIARAGYQLVISNVADDANGLLLSVLQTFNYHSTLWQHDEVERGAKIQNFLRERGCRHKPIILDSTYQGGDDLGACWFHCDEEGVSLLTINDILARLKAETGPLETIPKSVRREIKASLAETGLNFTYVRKFDENDRVEKRGGATIAWTIDDEKFDHATIKYAIVRCYYRDLFDKLRGREYAVQAFNDGNVGYCPIPADNRISEFLKKEFRV